MTKLFIPAFCLLHMAAIFWWSLPHSFGNMVLANAGQSALEERLFKWVMLDKDGWTYSFFQNYIDVTGSQQYWDFFAPQSPKFHQYLSVCDSIAAYPEQGKIACKGQTLFTNLGDDFEVFKRFGSHRSRLYRLTENLANLEDPRLLETFTQYYRTYQHGITEAQLVLHQFELHPGLKDLPRAGYQMDKLLWVSH